MAVGDTRFINGASVTLDINDKTKYYAALPQGIYDLRGELVMADIPRKTPVGIYLVNNMKVRTIEQRVIVRGATPSAQITNLRALVVHFAQCMRDDQDGIYDYTAPDSIQRYIRCAVREIVVENDPAGEPDAVALTLEAPDHTFYATSPSTGSGAFNGATPVNISMANAGDWPAYPVITYTGVVVNPIVTDAYGSSLKIEGSMAAGSVLVITIEPRAFSIMYTPSGGPATSWYAKRVGEMVFVKPGTNNMTFVADSGNATIGISAYARHSAHG